MYRFIAPLFVPSVVLALSAAYYMESVNVDPIDKILIKPVCLSILAFYLYFIAVEYVRYKKRFQVPCKEGGADCHTKIKIPYKEMLIIGMTALYVWIIQYLGFVVTSIFFMAAMLYILNVRKLWVVCCFSVASSAILYIAFKVVLMVPLPGGILGF
ncbi:tripartite tricarboxylate transporter TctB family protein [Cloacibacillus evryensis]|uniref:tripartite tricarboxylate transporter TctB family protein n=1 Tax=Cloacibacillus evryensis TaxID=508460 RepID=UPI0004474638|nr:tripartite tricarboxylate transporter TctB family protein [Cloacibacillus evryensis]EXG78057.1 hypothetical protein Cloev_0161 [Cloacibacillus evryensis DSM 19522]MEA5034879.1 tripartite tricarboxylate transporter TctB family protein [Cloacibacillus evryensis]